MAEKILYSLQEAAKYTGIPVKTVRACATGMHPTLPPISGFQQYLEKDNPKALRWRFTKKDIDAWLKRLANL